MASIRPSAKAGPELASLDVDTLIVLDAFNIDAAIEESHEQSVQWTSHAVSGGVKFTDHYQLDGGRYTAQGLVSNTPIDETANTSILGPDRVKQADTLLLSWTRQGVPIRITTGLRVYPVMGITNYGVNRNAQTGQALSFSLELQEIRIVNAETVLIPDAIIRADTAPSAQAKTDAGTQTGTATTPESSQLAGEASSRDKTVAAGLFDALGNLGG